MTQEEFLNQLGQVFNKYKWSYEKNLLKGMVSRGNNKGMSFNPVTAVARSTGVGVFPSTKRGTLQAARALGITKELALAVISSSNRGNAQIVRGKMLLELF